jgi:DMSO/TMAO reductase YedYZ molybdopterin-dependent catalytic subunit
MPIPRQHGFPCRAIIPGHAGARNCKFLERITVTPNPCQDAGNWKQYATAPFLQFIFVTFEQVRCART